LLLIQPYAHVFAGKYDAQTEPVVQSPATVYRWAAGDVLRAVQQATSLAGLSASPISLIFSAKAAAANDIHVHTKS